MGVEKWIDLQLHPERIDDPKADQLLAQVLRLQHEDERHRSRLQHGPAASAPGQKDRRKGLDDGQGRDARRRSSRKTRSSPRQRGKRSSSSGEVQSAKLARAVTSDRQLDEVMVDFWENHFSVFAGKGQTRLFLAQYDRDVIRPNALGKFRDLLGAVAKSPAMLFFLDNWQSAADSTQPTLAARGGGRSGRAGLRPGIIARRPARSADSVAVSSFRPRCANVYRTRRPKSGSRSCNACSSRRSAASTRTMRAS